ncbi:hypothetical protein [Burkholderia ambifaria]|uniref:hypothetical protein n=1 Tax=Burkholderia ambifaria TaxID=152480 RepID=UPI00158C5934|nr:hypothetical protein [Burkholderia ambifaria]
MNNKPNLPEVFLKDLPPDAQSAVTQQFASLSDAIMQAALNWGFEVVKHLVVLNGAGLAAIVAIGQILGTSAMNRSLVLTGAHVFVGGLMVALFDMIAIYVTGLVTVWHFSRRTLMFSIGAAPISALKLSLFHYALIGINWALALVSVGLFIRGGLYIAAIT